MNAQPQLQLLEAQVGDGLSDLIAASERRLTELRRERDAVQREIEAMETKLRVWEATQHSLGSGKGKLRAIPSGRLPTKPQAVLALLGEQPCVRFPLAEIRRVLIDRGWMEDNKKARHALEVAVINLANRGAIQRVETGVYALPSPSADRNGMGSTPGQKPGSGVASTPLPAPPIGTGSLAGARAGT